MPHLANMPPMQLLINGLLIIPLLAATVYSDLLLSGSVVKQLKSHVIECGPYKGHQLDTLRLKITKKKKRVTAKLEAMVNNVESPSRDSVAMTEPIFDEARVLAYTMADKRLGYLQSFEIELGEVNTKNWYSRFFTKGDHLRGTVVDGFLNKRFKLEIIAADGGKVADIETLDPNAGCPAPLP